MAAPVWRNPGSYAVPSIGEVAPHLRGRKARSASRNSSAAWRVSPGMSKRSNSGGHGAGTRGGEMFKFDPYDYVIVGLDTKDGPDHPLYDERINMPVPETLIRNIRAYGVLKPVLFERDGDRPLVVDGRQRVRAARIVRDRQREAGEDEISVRGIPQRGDGSHLFAVSRAANLHQADGPLTQARNAQRMVDLGKSTEEIAVAFGVTEQTVGHWLSLLDLAPAVRTAVERGVIKPTAAVKLRKLDRNQQVEKLGELIAGGAKPTVSAARDRVREARGLDPVVTPKARLRQIESVLRELAGDGASPKATIAERSHDDLVGALIKIGDLCGVGSQVDEK